MQERCFTINDKLCPFVPLDDFDTDDERLLYEYTDGTVVTSDWTPIDPALDAADVLERERRRRIQHPGVTQTYLHVAYKRQHPDVAKDAIREIIGRTKSSESIASFHPGGDEEDPPASTASTSDPDESSSRRTNGSDSSPKPKHESSGSDSRTDSVHSDRIPAATGTGVSDT